MTVVASIAAVGHFQMVLENEGPGEGASSSHFLALEISLLSVFPNNVSDHCVPMLGFSNQLRIIFLYHAAIEVCTLHKTRSTVLYVECSSGEESGISSHGTFSRDNLTGQSHGTNKTVLLLLVAVTKQSLIDCELRESSIFLECKFTL